jgi:hypothetical protein
MRIRHPPFGSNKSIPFLTVELQTNHVMMMMMMMMMISGLYHLALETTSYNRETLVIQPFTQDPLTIVRSRYVLVKSLVIGALLRPIYSLSYLARVLGGTTKIHGVQDVTYHMLHHEWTFMMHGRPTITSSYSTRVLRQLVALATATLTSLR